MRVPLSWFGLAFAFTLSACGEDGTSTYVPGTGGTAGTGGSGTAGSGKGGSGTSGSGTGGSGGGGSTLPEDVGDPALNPGWAIMAGDIESDWGLGVTTDADDNAYVVGYFNTAIDFGGDPLMGGLSAFIAKFANDGTHAWSRTFAGQGFNQAWDVDEAGGVVYVTGEAGGEVDFGQGVTTGSDAGFVAALDAETGDTLWANRFSISGRIECRGIAATANAVYAACVYDGIGDLFGTSLATAGNMDLLITALDPATGDGLWARGYGTAGVESSGAVAITAEGGPVFVGQIDGEVDFGGGAMGQEQSSFVVSLTPDGAHQHSRALTSSRSVRLYDVATDAAGNIFVTGDFRELVDFGGTPLAAKGGSDVLLVSYDSAGGVRFGWGFGDVEDPTMMTFQSGIDSGMGVSVGLDDNVYLTGSFQLTVDFGGGPFTYTGGGGDTDIFVASFTNDGKHRWSRPFGGQSGETGWAIAPTSSGQAFLTGRSYNALDFGTGTLTNAGEEDVYVVRLE